MRTSRHSTAAGVALATLFLALTGCATTVVDRWKDPGFNGPALHHVLVVGIQKDQARRRVWEDAVVAALTRQGVQANPSYVVFPDKVPTPEELIGIAKRDGLDGVFSSHPVVGSERATFGPGGPDAFGLGWGWGRRGWRGRYYGYYGWDYPYTDVQYRADYQTDVYDIGPTGGTLIWTGTTRALDQASVAATTDLITKGVVPELVKAGILAPTKH